MVKNTPTKIFPKPYNSVIVSTICLLGSLVAIYALIPSRDPSDVPGFPYDPKIAFKMLGCSAAAYEDNPKTLLSKVLDETPDILIKAQGQCSRTNCLCFGYAAVLRNNNVIVGFRGTSTTRELIKEIRDTMRFRTKMPFGGRVHEFFHSCHEQLYPKLSPLVKNGPNDIFVTGHSLGAALASLFAAQISFEMGAQNRRYHYEIIDFSNSSQRISACDIKNRLKVMTFGQPRVGDSRYANLYDQLVPNTWRVVHNRDIVAHIPPCNVIAERSCRNGSMYYHTGTEVFYGANMTVDSRLYSICHGLPRNEDLDCSDGLSLVRDCYDIKPCIDDHLTYFGMHVSNWSHVNDG